jgi:hypothetical protein
MDDNIKMKITVFWDVTLGSLIAALPDYVASHPKDNNLHSNHRDNFKSYIILKMILKEQAM